MRNALGWAALIAALVGTASAEYKIAIACGFGTMLAACVPAALDIYALAAFRTHRDVGAVVVALICVNSASHLVSTGHLPVSVPLVVAVSAIAPLVLWRVHALMGATKPDAVEMQPVADAPAPQMQPSAAPPEADAEEMQPQPDAPAEQMQPLPDAVADLLADARALDAKHRASTGRGASLRLLQNELRIGQPKAMQLKAALTG